MKRRIHASHMRRIHAGHMKRRIHACHMRRRIPATPRDGYPGQQQGWPALGENPDA
jgi:hypothetical protein